jgi:hypothetical protein
MSDVENSIARRQAAATSRERGKVVDTFPVLDETGAALLATVAVRLRDGKFSAEHGGSWYVANTLANLKLEVTAVVRASGATEWDPCIEIEHVGDGNSRGHHESGVRATLEVSYTCVLVSRNVYTATANNERWESGGWEYRLHWAASVPKAGDPVGVERVRPIRVRLDADHKGETLIPWTRERWDALDRVVNAMGVLRDRLAGLLNGKDTAALLDGLKPDRLLAPVARKTR